MTYALLYDHIEKLKDRVLRPAAGLLPYQYIVPTADTGADAVQHRQMGVYEQQYDWDCFFEGIAMAYDGAERAAAFRDAMRNFLHFTTADGYTPRTLSPEKFWDYPDHMKPFLAQGCLFSSRALDDFSWIDRENYDRILATLRYWETQRFGGHGLSMWRSALESGVDNNATSVMLPDLSVEAVDVNSYLVREFHAAAEIARVLGHLDDAARLQAKGDELARRMNAVLWNEEDGCYYDVFSVSDEPIAWIKTKSWTVLTPLWAGVATPERAKTLIERYVLDPKTFWGPFGVPSVARNEVVYNQAKRGYVYIEVERRRWVVSNWLGPVWIVANWQIMHGLLRYGYAEQAKELAVRITQLLERDVEATGGMHENYDAETGVGLWSPNFGSWNMLAARMIEEAETGHDPARI